MSLKRKRSAADVVGATSEQRIKRQRVVDDADTVAAAAAAAEEDTRNVVREVHHVNPPMDIYHTKTQIPCRAPDSGRSEQGYMGCVPDEIAATLTGFSELTKRRFRVNIYRGATRFVIGRFSATVLLDMRLYTNLRTVSHEHARIAYQPDINSFTLDNIGRNGTRVNGEVIRSGMARNFITLSHNDVITIGGRDMHFQLVNAL